MKVVPLAAESLGVRSMAAYAECGETRILIDPGASLAPSRYRLPPAEEEWDALKRANDRISAYAMRAETIFLSHYHEDHFRYDPQLYAGRRVWAKDPARMINPAQSRRGSELWKAIRPHCRLDSAEGRRWQSPDALLTVSPPLPHGVEGSALGYVVALSVTDRAEGLRFVHASDVQGPLSAVATAYLIRERPGLLFLSGPPCYLERQIGTRLIDQGIENCLRIIEATGCRVIMDHHALRDPGHGGRLRRLWDTKQVVTAAAYLGAADELLEAHRHALWARRRKPEARAARPRLKTPRPSDIVNRQTTPPRAKGGSER
jgi:predicted metallo-beta-lactamase superfamily hydrolase